MISGGKTEARLWTIAENLHRAELQPFEEAAALKEWERVLRKRTDAAQAAQPGGRQPHDKGISKTAKALGMSREKTRQLRRIANISALAQAAAKKAGLDRNREALVKIGKARTPKAQLEKVHDLAKQKKNARHESWSDRRQLRKLKKTFKAAGEFRQAWKDASLIVRRKFINGVLKASAR